MNDAAQPSLASAVVPQLILEGRGGSGPQTPINFNLAKELTIFRAQIMQQPAFGKSMGAISKEISHLTAFLDDISPRVSSLEEQGVDFSPVQPAFSQLALTAKAKDGKSSTSAMEQSRQALDKAQG